MKVTVILPSYNHAKYLNERIDSILNQTFQDFELIILDDLSPDNSKDIIEQYSNHPKVSSIVYNEKNSGSTFFQWNKGVSMAKGEYIWIAESDDIAHPLLLETLVDKIESQDDITLAFSQSFGIDSNSNQTNDWIDRTSDMNGGELFNHDFIMDGVSFIRKFLLFKNVIPNASAVLFRRNTYLEMGGASTDFSYFGDWLMWIKILTKGKVAYSQHRYNFFRRHEQSFVAKEYDNAEQFVAVKDIKFRINLLQFLKEINDTTSIQLNKEYIQYKSMAATRYLWFNHNKIKAFKYYWLYLKYSSNLKSSIAKSLRSLLKN